MLNNLKKFFSVLLLVAFIVIIIMSIVWANKYGSNNFPTSQYDNYIKTIEESNAALLNSQVKNPKEFSAQANLVAYTLQRERTANVIFLCKDESGEINSLPGISFEIDLMNQKEYRELYKAMLISKTVESLDSETPVEIIGTILQWEYVEYEIFSASSKTYHRYALCDMNGDGRWDYITGGDERLLGIGFTTSSQDYFFEKTLNGVSFTSSSEILDLKDLSGEETFYNFEKLLIK